MRKDTKGFKWVIISAIILMLVVMEYLYFIENKFQLVPKVILTLMIFVSFFFVFQKSKQIKDRVNDQMRIEKKSIKKIRKNLSNFDTRIISSLKASPASFSRILTNDLLYQDFRFDMH